MTYADGNEPMVGDVVRCIDKELNSQWFIGAKWQVTWTDGELLRFLSSETLFDAKNFQLIRRAAAATTTKGK